MSPPPTPPTDLEELKRQQRALFQANAKYYWLLDEQFHSGDTYEDVLVDLVRRRPSPARFLGVGSGSGYYVR